MGRGRILLGLAAAAGAAAALLLGGVLRESTPAEAQPGPLSPSLAAQSLQTGFAAGGTAQLVERLQSAVRAEAADVRSLDLLGLAYQQRARETGDPVYYTNSEGVLRRALARAAHDLLATSGLGSLAISRHRFRKALQLGRRARAISPSTARSYGVIGDALIELGRYRAAFRAYDEMARRKPSLASYARVAHARELIGDTPGAVSAMRLALEAAGGQGEPLAWTHVQLGKLFWNHGRLEAAAKQYRAALAAFPGYVYAFDALAAVEAARGHLRRAIALERRAVDVIPLPQFVGMLGDLHRVSGQASAARRQYALVGVIERLLRANGVQTDLETAVFDVDHARRLPHALALARAAQRARPSIDGEDLLAWALARNGRCGEALVYSRRALRLGTPDAAKLFHRGMIERCLGRPGRGRPWFRRARALNPHFSPLWAPVARRYAR